MGISMLAWKWVAAAVVVMPVVSVLIYSDVQSAYGRSLEVAPGIYMHQDEYSFDADCLTMRGRLTDLRPSPTRLVAATFNLRDRTTQKEISEIVEVPHMLDERTYRFRLKACGTDSLKSHEAERWTQDDEGIVDLIPRKLFGHEPRAFEFIFESIK